MKVRAENLDFLYTSCVYMQVGCSIVTFWNALDVSRSEHKKATESVLLHGILWVFLSPGI